MTWREVQVSPCGTHHVRDGVPLYAERFDEVFKFRDPGFAAVQRGGKGWHIRTDGTAAHQRRFHRTFSFYGGLAAVVATDGWHHIRPDGAELHDARFAWCGNFQDGRCAVREFDGAYLHLTREGVPACEARWRYAGDFRDGVAVVQAEDGRSTHIDRHGEPIHGVRFLDLDVFHKGFARARDDDGWMHIDAAGRSPYRRRFAAVEPFYNGQARVERFDGGLEVIDETGNSIVELRPSPNGAVNAIDWRIPSSVTRWLARTPADAPVTVLLRHSVRGPLPCGDAGDAVPLTRDGSRLARRLGTLLCGRVRTLHVSPLPRCVQTGEALRSGAGAEVAIVPDRLLGDPGVYVADSRRAWSNWEALGHDAVMQSLMTGSAALPGMADADSAARFLVRHMLAIAGDSPGLHLFITHDSVIVATVARLLGEPLGRDDWPWFLEGAFFWRAGGCIVTAYRDRLVQRPNL